MFIFKSSDSENGKERKKRFEIEITKYAFEIFPDGNREKIAEFCGVNRSTIYNRIMKYKELNKFRGWVNFHPNYYTRKDLWKTKN